jgi:hypothetical protein
MEKQNLFISKEKDRSYALIICLGDIKYGGINNYNAQEFVNKLTQYLAQWHLPQLSSH